MLCFVLSWNLYDVCLFFLKLVEKLGHFPAMGIHGTFWTLANKKESFCMDNRTDFQITLPGSKSLTHRGYTSVQI